MTRTRSPLSASSCNGSAQVSDPPRNPPQIGVTQGGNTPTHQCPPSPQALRPPATSAAGNRHGKGDPLAPPPVSRDSPRFHPFLTHFLPPPLPPPENRPEEPLAELGDIDARLRALQQFMEQLDTCG